MRAMALTLFIPKCIDEASALLLDTLLQGPLSQAKVSEGGQGEPPLLLPQVPTGGDQSWQKHPTMSHGRSFHRGEKAPELCLISSCLGHLQGQRFDLTAEICVLADNSPSLLKISLSMGISGRSMKFSAWFTRTSLIIRSPFMNTNDVLPICMLKMSPYFSVSWEGRK